MRTLSLYVDIRESAHWFFNEKRLRRTRRQRRRRRHTTRCETSKLPVRPRTSGDHSAVAPPVPIPNTEVKRCSPDGSACIACARVGRRQNLCPVSWKQGAGLFSFRRRSFARRHSFDQPTWPPSSPLAVSRFRSASRLANCRNGSAG